MFVPSMALNPPETNVPRVVMSARVTATEAVPFDRL
jgi:hypothetical protein